MKIKIIAEVPVQKKYRPTVGEIYEVCRVDCFPGSKRIRLFFININGEEVGIYPRKESEVVEW